MCVWMEKESEVREGYACGMCVVCGVWTMRVLAGGSSDGEMFCGVVVLNDLVGIIIVITIIAAISR